jgi:rhodanese-related sulfurtransferase
MELETVSVDEAHAEVVAGKALLVDVRRPDEWALTGTPQGAHRLTMDDPEFLTKIDKLTGGDKTRRLLFTCRTGARSGSVQRGLSDMGYSNVVNVRGGMMGTGTDPGWAMAGLPIDHKP